MFRNSRISLLFVVFVTLGTPLALAADDCGYKADGKYHCGTDCGNKADGKFHCDGDG